MNDSEAFIEIQNFIEQEYKDQLELICSSENSDQRFDLEIDVSLLLDYTTVAIPLIYNAPSEFIEVLKNQAQELLLYRGIERNIDIRLISPPTSFFKADIGNIGVEDDQKLITLSGTITRCGNVRSLAHKKDFKCVQCGTIFRLESLIELYNGFDLPPKCPSKKCRGKNFEGVEKSEEWKDYREVKVQDLFSNQHRGKLPPNLWVVLSGNLVNSCNPGDDVTITGVLITRWMPLLRTQQCDLDFCLVASSLRVHSSKLEHNIAEVETKEKLEDFEFRAKLIDSFAPKIFGNNHIKLGMLLCAIGGMREEISGLRLRGHCHCLIVGEPGTGKSQLLREACLLHLRGVSTSAVGASIAGLTVSAVKEGSEWMLEAGALVLADCGICCIDDIAMLAKEDLRDIYESMESQTISVAKAGMVCTVNARTTIIGACRPKKNRFDFGVGIDENSGLPSPLLSRFDLVFILIDQPDPEADAIKSNFILCGGHQSKKSLFSPGQLQYFLKKSREILPPITEEASEILGRYFDLIKNHEEIVVTIRHLESLLRLSQAHARLCQRDEVNSFDTTSVILLMESTCRGAGLLSIPPEDCFKDQNLFNQTQNEILVKLGYMPIIPKGFAIDDSILED
ncbi:MCM9_2 [Blepharisma stoltei]|uniref:MCM C-terminal AAA(+) ATPase domain-containing protein n=1 Tax=Blepharisma stoltei TaxID=1481888 RepID=A0AAU9IZ55_9CILI|nr:unnamed protein product [Blepharisma stoltei]